MTRRELMLKIKGNLKQSELAGRLGVDQGTVSRLAGDTSSPKCSLIAALLREFPEHAADIMSVFLLFNVTDMEHPSGNNNGAGSPPA